MSHTDVRGAPSPPNPATLPAHTNQVWDPVPPAFQKSRAYTNPWQQNRPAQSGGGPPQSPHHSLVYPLQPTAGPTHTPEPSNIRQTSQRPLWDVARAPTQTTRTKGGSPCQHPYDANSHIYIYLSINIFPFSIGGYRVGQL
ncbi:hypothetical protein GOODEAATRI_028889 [Goodea atripinnis]|uniref:Uncharacterized protein n=1 Tax=Goodea atripinnis TaxID=208336 RepID=A0ABV0N7C4_9TELE